LELSQDPNFLGERGWPDAFLANHHPSSVQQHNILINKGFRGWWHQFLGVGGTSFWRFILGVMYQEGDGVPTDDVRAKELLKRACEGGIKEACKDSK